MEAEKKKHLKKTNAATVGHPQQEVKCTKKNLNKTQFSKLLMVKGKKKRLEEVKCAREIVCETS